MARQTTPYIYGSTARNWETARPLPDDEFERRRQRQHRPKRQPKPKVRVDKVAVCFTCLTFLAVMTAGIIYVRLQFQSTYLNKNVVNLQSEVVEMEKENAAAERELDNAVDLTAIYNRATNELGMVAATEEQMDTYESRKSTQIRRHGTIPTD